MATRTAGAAIAAKDTVAHKYQLTLEGITPLLMAPMSDETMESITTGVARQVDRSTDYRSRAELLIYRDDDDKPCVPVVNLMAALRDAGSLIKFDTRRNVTGGGATLLYTFLNVCDGVENLPLINLMSDGPIKKGRNLFEVKDGWHFDRRPGRLPNGTACIVIRPCFPKWGLGIVVTVDHDLIDVEKVWKLFELAGKGKGLCAARPSCGMPFGQFQVVKIKELPMTKRAKAG